MYVRGVPRRGLSHRPAGDIVPNPLDKELHRTVARAVARVAVRQGLNRDDLTGSFD